MKIKIKKQKGGVSTILAMIICSIIGVTMMVYVISQATTFMINQRIDTINQQAVVIACRSGGVTSTVEKYITSNIQNLVKQGLLSEVTVKVYYYDINEVYSGGSINSNKIKEVATYTINSETINFTGDHKTVNSTEYVGSLLQRGKTIGISIQETGTSTLQGVVKLLTGQDYNNVGASSYRESMVEQYSYTGADE